MGPIDAYMRQASRASFGSDNGLLPIRHQAIIWTNTGTSFIWPLEMNFSDIWIKNTVIFIHEKEFANVICNMASILSGRHCVSGCTDVGQARLLVVE